MAVRFLNPQFSYCYIQTSPRSWNAAGVAKTRLAQVACKNHNHVTHMHTRGDCERRFKNVESIKETHKELKKKQTNKDKTLFY